MKKYILSLSVMLSIITTSSFANNNPFSEEKAKQNFKKEFAAAESAIWKQEGDFYKVSFVYLGNTVIAYYNENGELEGSIRNLKTEELPLIVLTALYNRFENADVLDVYEVNNSEGTNYKITFYQNDKKYKVKMDFTGNISEREKIKK